MKKFEIIFEDNDGVDGYLIEAESLKAAEAVAAEQAGP